MAQLSKDDELLLNSLGIDASAQPAGDPSGNVGRFLGLIAKAEGADYDTVVGGSRFSDFSTHPNKVGLRTAEGPSTAAGRYQITGTTYRDVAGKLGITDFSPESQDRIALELIRRNGALEDVQAGNFDAAIKKLGPTWASLPSSPYSQPKRSMEWVRDQLGDDYETEFNRASGAQPLSRNYSDDVPGTDIAGDVRRRDEAENGDISVSDFLRSVGATAAGMAEGAGWAANKVLGVGEGVQKVAKSARESLEEGMSPRMKGARVKKFFDDTEDGFEAGSAWTDPVAIADTIVQGMVSLIPMGATSITAARMAGASAAKAAAAEAAAQGLAGQAAKEFVATAVSKAAGRAATVGGGAMEGFLEGSGAGQQTGDQVRGIGLDVLQKNSPMFRDLVEGGATPEQAREEVAMATENEAALSAGAVAMATGAAGGHVLGKMVAPVKPGWMGTSRTGGAIAGGIGEGLPEAVQGGAGQYAQNLAVKKYADETQDPWAGVADASAREGIGGLGMGVGAGAIQKPEAPKPARVENSPLSNAVNAAGPQAAPTAPAEGAENVHPQGSTAMVESDPIKQRLDAIRPFIEDRDLIRAIRKMPEFGSQSVDELLGAWAMARNPNTDQRLRENLLGQIEQFLDTVKNRPNWQAGSNEAGGLPVVAGTAPQQQPRGQAAIEDVPLDGDATEIIPESRRLEGEGDINGRRPQLETEDAIQARRDADAAYEQAFNDLVKADALAASDQELMQKQQAVREAKAAREEADARLAEIQRTIEDGRRQQTEEKRRAILDDILADPETKNPAERFAAELGRQGFADTDIAERERAQIQRFSDIKDAEAVSDAEPSSPNEFDPYYTKTRAEPVGRMGPQKPAKQPATTKDAPANGTQAPQAVEAEAQGQEQAPVARSPEVEQAIAKHDALIPAWKAAKAAGDTDAMRALAPQIESARAGVIAAQDGVAATDSGVKESLTAGEPSTTKESLTVENASATRPESGAQGAAGQEAPADPGVAEIHNAVKQAEAQTAPAPSAAQKKAGNYKKGKVDLHGQRISIETPKGAERSGTDEDGSPWSVTMPANYGYFLGTLANDGDHVDVFIGPKPEAGMFWVVNQNKVDSSKYDEPKVMLGYESAESAQADYLASFSGNFGGRVFGSIVGPFSVAELGKKLPKMKRNKPVDGPIDKKAKPANLIALVRKSGGVSISRLADVTGESNPNRSGAIGVFRKNGMELDQLASLMVEHGFMTQDEVDSDVASGANRASDLLRAALSGELVLSNNDVDAAMDNDAEREYRSTIRSRADELGIRKVARKFEDIEADVLAADNLGDEDLSQYDLERAGGIELSHNAMAAVEAFDDFQRATKQDAISAMRAMGFTEEEINEQTQSTDEGTIGTEGADSGRSQAGGASDTQARRNSPEEGGGFSLEAPTAEGLRRQAQAEQARADEEQKAHREAEERARKKSELAEIKRRSEAAADTFVLGGDDMANLSGQGGLFSDGIEGQSGELNTAEQAGEKKGSEERRMEAELDKVPDDVQGLVLRALSGLSDVRDSLENVKRARGAGHILALEVRDAQPEIAKHMSTLDEFRKFAPGNGVDADLVIEALGGVPDLSVFGPPAQQDPQGQRSMADRGSRIAALKAMNAQLRAIAPDEAWSDGSIEDADNLDALQDAISAAVVSAGQPEAATGEDALLRKRLEDASGAELKEVFDSMSLAGSRLSHDERVNLLMAEDRNEVASALDLAQRAGEAAAPSADSQAATETQPDAPSEAVDEEAPNQIKSATGNDGTFDPANPNILASKRAAPRTNETPESIRSALIEELGESGVAALESGGLLNIVASTSDVPAGLRIPGAEAVYDPETGRAFLIADQLAAGRAVGAVLHELGEHHGLESFVGSAGWRALRVRLASMAKVKGSAAMGAWEAVKAVYDEFAGMSDAELSRNDRFAHEVLAKMGESADVRGSSLWRDIKRFVSRALLNMGISFHVSDAHIADLIAGSLKRLMRNGGGGPRGGVEIIRARTDAPAPMASIRDIAGTREGRRSIRAAVGDAISGVFDGSSAKTFNWWDRTVSPQYYKAKKDRDFGRVYDKAHDFIDDVSRIANESADRARSILPHLDGFRDALRGLKLWDAVADARDYEAIAPAIFDGTLLNGTTGRVFSDDELRSRYGMTERQIGLYHEFRDAVDFSLESLAVSEMARTARAAKMRIAPRGMGMDDSARFYSSQLDEQIDAARAAVHDTAGALVMQHNAEREAMDGLALAGYDEAAVKSLKSEMGRRHRAEIAEAMSAVNELVALRDSFSSKADQIRKLQQEGYAPLMRFGQYIVDVAKFDENGEPVIGDDGNPDRPFFGMFETEAEAKEAAEILAEEYTDYTVSRGVASQHANEMFKGVTPEAAEMFARMLGVTEGEGFQAYLKQAIANRSAMKRLIKRKGMEGFSKDVPRVLAAFITSNARLSSGNWHFGDMNAAIQRIPKHKGDVIDESVKLAKYIQNPQEEAAGIRGLMFFNFLGGSVASALVNMTQSFTTTLPFLAQYGGTTRAAKSVSGAMSLAAKVMGKKGFDAIDDRALREALMLAAEEGITDPQEVHMLMSEAGGNGGLSNLAARLAGKINKSAEVPVTRVARALTHAWGGMFSAAEKYNRHVAFIAAWEVAPPGVDRYQFAKDAVTATQFDYTKASRANWGRGAVGATLFTFRTFMLSYIGFLSNLPPPQRALALAVLLVFAGMSGMPGADDMDDIIDTIGQKLGYNWNNKADRHSWLVKTLGVDIANLLEHGISSVIPIDVSARLGMGNIVPGSGLFKKSANDKGREVAEVFGAPGAYFMNLVKSGDAIGGGEGVMGAIRPILPKALDDMRKAIDMVQTGEYRDTRGRKVVDVSWFDAFIKSIGFQPNTVAEPRRVERMLAQSAGMQRAVRSDVHELWANGIAENKPEKVRDAKRFVEEWNRKNPDSQIKINMKSILARVKASRMRSADRLVKATPKDMRGMLAAELELN